MKKIISLLLAILFLFSLTACNNEKDTSSGSDTSMPVLDEAFVKPENYSTVLVVTINPQFRLYLDSQSNVLAVEPVNDDAKSITEEDAFDGKLSDVIEKIVTKANDGGFVKENATVNFEITELKSKDIKTDELLNTVKSTADSAFKKINVTVSIEASVSEDIAEQSAPLPSSSQQAESSQPTVSNTPIESSKPVESVQTHTHNFSAATCAKPKTCSCGATEGKALEHNYKDGKCTLCGAKDPKPSFTSLTSKNGTWVTECLIGETYCKATFRLTGEPSLGLLFGDPLSAMEQEIQDDIRNNKNEPDYKESYLVYKDKEYWCARGDGTDFKPFSEENNTVTLVSLDEAQAQVVLTRTDENTLTVKSVSGVFKDMLEDIPIGTKFIFTAN